MSEIVAIYKELFVRVGPSFLLLIRYFWIWAPFVSFFLFVLFALTGVSSGHMAAKPLTCELLVTVLALSPPIIVT